MECKIYVVGLPLGLERPSCPPYRLKDGGRGLIGPRPPEIDGVYEASPRLFAAFGSSERLRLVVGHAPDYEYSVSDLACAANAWLPGLRGLDDWGGGMLEAESSGGHRLVRLTSGGNGGGFSPRLASALCGRALRRAFRCQVVIRGEWIF